MWVSSKRVLLHSFHRVMYTDLHLIVLGGRFDFRVIVSWIVATPRNPGFRPYLATEEYFYPNSSLVLKCQHKFRAI